jgi:hypothetical protein
MRLREGYKAARLIVAAYGDDSAKAWFFGSTTRLGDEAPAYVLLADLRPNARMLAEWGRVFAGAGVLKRMQR